MPSPAVLTRQTLIMDFQWVIETGSTNVALTGSTNVALFAYEEYAEEGPLFLRLRVEDWRDMGEPRTITVTIEPGDKLNGGEDGN